MATLKYKTNNGYVPLPTQVVRKTNEENGFGIGVCSTAAATAAKEVAITNYELVKNGFVAIRFTYDVPANATLNINSKGAKAIYYKGSAIAADVIKAGDTVQFCYDGTNYVLVGSSVNTNETVNISVTQIGGNSSDLIGTTVVVSDADSGEVFLNTTWTGSTISLDIPVGTSYKVEGGTISGYITGRVTYVARFNNIRNIELQYKGYGVYVEAIDGTLYSSSTWGASGKTANSVVLITQNNGNYRIGLNTPSVQLFFANQSDMLDYMSPSEIDGYINTKQLINYAKNKDLYYYGAGVYFIDNFKFPNGAGDSFIPSKEQHVILCNNSTAIDACFSACRGSAIGSSVEVHTSTILSDIISGKNTFYDSFWPEDSKMVRWPNQNAIIIPIAYYK